MSNPLQFATSQTDWQFFVTLTYGSIPVPRIEGAKDIKGPARRGGKVPSEMVRRRMFFQFLRKFCKGFRCPMEHVLFLAREEFGERGGRAHWHCLLGGVRDLNSNATTNRFVIKAYWESCGKSAGGADVREYDPRQAGASYVLKGLESLDPDSFNLDLANSYELQKFDDSLAHRKLILGRGWIRKFQRMKSNKGHQFARQSGKIPERDRSARGMRRGGVPRPARLAHPYA